VLAYFQRSDFCISPHCYNLTAKLLLKQEVVLNTIFRICVWSLIYMCKYCAVIWDGNWNWLKTEPSNTPCLTADTSAYIYIYHMMHFLFGATAPRGPWFPHSRGFQITYSEHHSRYDSCGRVISPTLLWQHTTLTTDKHPCPQLDSNPQAQQVSVRRPTP
jgi:hypothetical protein